MSNVKIIQIAPVVENWNPGGEYHSPNEDATIYGLGDDGNPYVWCVIKTVRVKLSKKEMEEYETDRAYRDERVYGWRLAS